MCVFLFSSTQHDTKLNEFHSFHDNCSQYVTLLRLQLTDADPLNAAMSTMQTQNLHHHFVNLGQYEMSIASSIKEQLDGTWSCEVCNFNFDDIMQIVTHLLTSCDDGSSIDTFSTLSAINICMVFDVQGSRKMLETYIRLFGNDTDSDLDNDTDHEMTELPEIHNQGSVEQENEAVAKDSQPPKYAEFSVTPPATLSAKDKAEWIFKRARKLPILSTIGNCETML